MSSFDVMVIGSGPAGCAAASTCATAGLRVCILTAEAAPTHKTESTPAILESIHPGVSSLLTKIGAGGAEDKAIRAYYAGIYSGGHYKPLGEDESGVWKGMHIHRGTFNAQLAQTVVRAGVSVMHGEQVEDFIMENGRVVGVRTKSAHINASYVIDASGKKAVAGRKLNFKRKFFSPPLICWTGISEGIEHFPFDPHSAHFVAGKNGWTWFAPQLPDCCAWTRLTAVGEKSFLPPPELKNYPAIGKIDVANMRWRMYRPVCREGVVLCGDAAGMLDPAAGQGIFNALMSGITAANTVVSCIHQPEIANFHLAKYDQWFVEQFEAKVNQLKQYYSDHSII